MTPEEKKSRKLHSQLLNRCKSEFSFKKIKTFRDYLTKGLGYDDKHVETVLNYRPDELDRSITFSELKDLLEDRRLAFECEWFLKNNPPDTSDLVKSNGTPHITVTIPDHEIQKASDILDAEHDYGIEPSAKEKAFLFWFQKKYAVEILNKIRIHGLHAVLLIAQAGTGKTYILGAVLRRLLDADFHKQVDTKGNIRSVSPWPYCYITKASVVEQTKRVLTKYFQIDTVYECFITNYDQMRSDFGKVFVKEKTIVVHGEEHIVWTWQPMIHPCVFIFDESQAAKNESSIQSKIVCAVSEIANPHVYCIFSSATPFTRVSEAKYFVVNCRVDRKLF